MNLFVKNIAMSILAAYVISPAQSEAFCAKCAAIEQKREEENARNGPQPQKYYDEAHKEEISSVTSATSINNNLHSQNEMETRPFLQQQAKDRL